MAFFRFVCQVRASFRAQHGRQVDAASPGAHRLPIFGRHAVFHTSV